MAIRPSSIARLPRIGSTAACAVVLLAFVSADASRGGAAAASGARAPGETGGPSAEDARRELEQAGELAKQAGAPEVAAPILVNLGNQLVRAGDRRAGLARYREAAALAHAAGDPGLEARALANAARVALDEPEPAQARQLLEAGFGVAAGLPASHDKAYLLVNLARSSQRLAAQQPAAQRELLLKSWEALAAAGDLGAQLGDPRAESWAWGYLGGLYEAEGRLDEALELTQRALAAAERADARESLYLWQWQAGRLLGAKRELQGALHAYGAAVETLQEIRPQLSAGYEIGHSAFREVLVPIYYGRVDLLLRAARETSDPGSRQVLLEEARETIELLKADELKDYFRDECVLEARETRLDALPAVVVYPMLLEDRTEFIVSIGGELRDYTSPVGAAELGREVRAFRQLLEKRTTHQYLPHAQRLYDWLVRPYGKELAASGFDTLVVVPDGILRTIPFSALHDGEGFLVARYAVAMAPGLALVEPAPLDRSGLKLLLTGVSRPVQGFPPLEHVPEELAAIGGMYASTLLLDESFREPRLVRELEDRSVGIVHVASHGHFASDFEDSFLLTYDGRLSMNGLAQAVGRFRFRDRPLELLTLSACETAAGDDRAALGLAGVALKAGARSVLATLWTVSDRAAADLVIGFYRQLEQPSVSRAQALRRAQLAELDDPVHRHPAYWSAFVLISNWL